MPTGSRNLFLLQITQLLSRAALRNSPAWLLHAPLPLQIGLKNPWAKVIDTITAKNTGGELSEFVVCYPEHLASCISLIKVREARREAGEGSSCWLGGSLVVLRADWQPVTPVCKSNTNHPLRSLSPPSPTTS